MRHVLVNQHLVGLDALGLDNLAPCFLLFFKQNVFVAQVALLGHQLALDGIAQHFGQGDGFDHKTLNKNGDAPHFFYSVHKHLILKLLPRRGIEVVGPIAANGLAHGRIHDGQHDLVAVAGANFLMQGGQPVADNLEAQRNLHVDGQAVHGEHVDVLRFFLHAHVVDIHNVPGLDKMYAFLVGVLQLRAAAKTRIQHAQLAGLDGNDNARPEKQDYQRGGKATTDKPQAIASYFVPYCCPDFHWSNR